MKYKVNLRGHIYESRKGRCWQSELYVKHNHLTFKAHLKRINIHCEDMCLMLFTIMSQLYSVRGPS